MWCRILCAMDCSKLFTNMVPSPYCSNPVKGAPWSPFNRWGNWSLEKISNLSRVTQLESGRVRVYTRKSGSEIISAAWECVWVDVASYWAISLEKLSFKVYRFNWYFQEIISYTKTSLILNILFFYNLEKKTHCQLSWDTSMVLGDSRVDQPLQLWFLSSVTREAVSLAFAFLAWHLTAILLPIYHDKICEVLSTGKFLPFLSPMKQSVIALQESMAQQIFALLIIHFMPQALFVCGPLCVRDHLVFPCWMECSLSEGFFDGISRSPSSAHNSVAVVTIGTTLTSSALYCVSKPYSSYGVRFHQPLRLPFAGWLQKKETLSEMSYPVIRLNMNTYTKLQSHPDIFQFSSRNWWPPYKYVLTKYSLLPSSKVIFLKMFNSFRLYTPPLPPPSLQWRLDTRLVA